MPKDKLTYTSIKGDLDHSGNGVGTQTVDVSGYETRWIVLDINENGEVLLLPERNRDLQYIKGKGALSYLYLENEMHKLAGLYGHGYGADETKVFEYEVGSRIPSEKDTRKEHTKGTGARAMLIDDVEVPFGITTDERRQELNEDYEKEKYPIGSNKLEAEIYYPTLNKEHADINGLSINKKRLTDINQEYYYTYKILDLNTNRYDIETGKDVLKNILLGLDDSFASRRFAIEPDGVYFGNGFIHHGMFSISKPSQESYLEYLKKGQSIGGLPIVFLQNTNEFYKEIDNNGHSIYSLIKDKDIKSVKLDIRNPYNINLREILLKGTYADNVLVENKLENTPQNIEYTKSVTLLDGRKLENGEITYTLEGLPENVTYDIIKKQVGGKEEVIVQIYPKELSVIANVNKNDIYDRAKFNYDILLNKNGTNIDTKQLNEIADGKLEIAKYTEKKDIIDDEGNAVNYTLDIANFNDTVRKDNTYYTNTITKDNNTNGNEIIYNLNIVYDKAKYDEYINKITTDLSDIEKRVNTLKENDNTKKSDISKLEEEVKTAETNGGTDVLGKKKLDEDIASIKKRQEDEKTERNNLEKELQDLIAEKEKALETDSKLKEKADVLTEKITNLKGTIEKDDEKIKELENRIAKIEVLDVSKIEELEKKVADLEKENKKNKEDLEENQKTIKNLNELIEKIKKENKDAVDKLIKEKEDLEKKNKELEDENKKLKDAITELQAEIEQLKNLEGENKDLKDKIADLEGKVLEAEAKANDLKEKLDKCSKHGKDLESKIKELENTIKEQDEKIKKLEQEKADLEKRNKELEEKNKLNEEELKEKELLEKKIKELEEKVKTLEVEKEKLAKEALDKKEEEQKEKEKAEDSKEPGKVSDENANNKPTTRNNVVASNSKKNNSKNNTSNNKIPHAGAESVIILTIITAGAIVYAKKVMKK